MAEGNLPIDASVLSTHPPEAVPPPPTTPETTASSAVTGYEDAPELLAQPKGFKVVSTSSENPMPGVAGPIEKGRERRLAIGEFLTNRLNQFKKIADGLLGAPEAAKIAGQAVASEVGKRASPVGEELGAFRREANELTRGAFAKVGRIATEAREKAMEARVKATKTIGTGTMAVLGFGKEFLQAEAIGLGGGVLGIGALAEAGLAKLAAVPAGFKEERARQEDKYVNRSNAELSKEDLPLMNIEKAAAKRDQLRKSAAELRAKIEKVRPLRKLLNAFGRKFSGISNIIK